MSDDLRESMLRYIDEHVDNYEAMSELAVIYATKMDKSY